MNSSANARCTSSLVHLPLEVLLSKPGSRMRHCSHGLCTRQANDNIEGSKAAYCKQHAAADMVDVVSRRCARIPCTRQPTFNTKGSKDVAYCREHAAEDMVDVLRRQCSHHPCSRRPSCGLLADGVSTVCIRHKGDLVGSPVINFNSECKVKGCKKLVKWGPRGQQPTHCPHHGPLQEGLIRTVGTDRIKGTTRTSSSHVFSKCINNEDGRAAVKRTRYTMPWAVTPFAAEAHYTL